MRHAERWRQWRRLPVSVTSESPGNGALAFEA